jgi:S1-C subfamily serine protease
MATATKETRGKWKETDRRVRHPLQAVRGYIRRYIILEGIGLSLLYLTVAFWLQSLQGLTSNSSLDLYIRGLILTVVVLGLAALAVTKTILRLFREFSDKAMALLLERRFPRELGDRLITAVELADPKKSEKYGFSLPLTEKTIRDAAERVERVPVRRVFNWSRLRWIYILCACMTVGILTVLGTAVCLARGSSPMDFAWRFSDTAGIWVDRNVLMRDLHWPRQTYLEVLGFQQTESHPVSDVGSLKRAVRKPETDEEMVVKVVRATEADLCAGIVGLLAAPWGQGPVLGTTTAFRTGVTKIVDGTIASLEAKEELASERNERLGIELASAEAVAKIKQVDAGGPAEKAGLKPYDVIYQIDYNKVKLREMHIGAGETRDQLYVRAVKWMKCDLSVPGGWTPLMWKDVEALPAIDTAEYVSMESLMGSVKLEPNWDGWILDHYDLAGDWTTWPADQVQRQFKNEKVRFRMEELRDIAADRNSLLGVELAKFETKAIVKSVSKDGPAQKAGLKEGDRITQVQYFSAVEPFDVTDVRSLQDAAPGPRGDKELFVTVMRDGTSIDFKLAKLGEVPVSSGDHNGLLGVMLKNADDKGGAQVEKLLPNGPADQAGIKVDDKIVHVEFVTLAEPYVVTDVASLQGALPYHNTDKPAQVTVLRDGKAIEMKAALKVHLAVHPLGQIFERLSQLAAEPGMVRRIRELRVPDKVTLYTRTKTDGGTAPYDATENNKFGIGLATVPRTTTFTVRAMLAVPTVVEKDADGKDKPAKEKVYFGDYETTERTISVIPAPSLTSLTVDRLEPAYVYYRLKDLDQKKLKNVKHISVAEPLGLIGLNTIKVAVGSNVVFRGKLADVDQGRKLREIRVRAPTDNEILESGEKRDSAAVPKIDPIKFEGEATEFNLDLANVSTSYEFVLEFRDNFNAVGKQHLRVEAQRDDPPEAQVEIFAEKQMRKAKMRGKNARALPPGVADAWLITADAVLPLKGFLRDDYGITDANWVVRLELTDVEFSPESSKKNLPQLVTDMPAGGVPTKVEPIPKIKDYFDQARPLTMPLRDYLYSFGQWERNQERRAVTLDQIAQLNDAERGSVRMRELIQAGEYDGILSQARDLLDMRERVLGPDHVDVAKSLRIVASILEGGKGDEAEARILRDRAAVIDQPHGVRFDWPTEIKDDFRLTNVRRLIDRQRTPANDLFLPRLKADGKHAQLHYFMYLSVSATDNNVERGPNTTPGKQPIKFLIVSDTEFLAQIAEDEAALSDRLEKAYKSLERVRVMLDEQSRRLAVGTPTYEDIRNHRSLAQTYLAESIAVSRGVFKEYESIVQHLEINQARVEGNPDVPFGPMNKKLTEVKNTIATPLGNLVQGQPIFIDGDKINPLFGPKHPSVDFPTLEANIKRQFEATDLQLGVIPADRLAKLREEVKNGKEDTVRLMEELNGVLKVMAQVVTFEAAKILLNQLAKEETARAREMREITREIEAQILRDLLDPKK